MNARAPRIRKSLFVCVWRCASRRIVANNNCICMCVLLKHKMCLCCAMKTQYICTYIKLNADANRVDRRLFICMRGSGCGGWIRMCIYRYVTRWTLLVILNSLCGFCGRMQLYGLIWLLSYELIESSDLYSYVYEHNIVAEYR